MESLCPKCKSENTYQDGNIYICPECSYEWMPNATNPKELKDETADTAIRDASGNILYDGDSVVVIKDLKIKGASSTIKAGTKVRNIRLYDAGDGHNISCKIDGLGSINLKSEFVRKA